MKKLDDLTLVTLTCNNLPYNFLFLGGRLSDGSSEFWCARRRSTEFARASSARKCAIS